MFNFILLFIMLMHLSSSMEKNISLNGKWKIWFDREARWNKEKVYLTPVDLKSVENYLPTIGWDNMFSRGIQIDVPSTWEEIEPEYDGVAWYWKKIKIPEEWKDKIIRIKFWAVRYRAEVYLNKKLVGYNIEGSTPFIVDITDFVRYGAENVLAVRVTDPGGGNSWMDFNPIKFGDVQLPDSHNFGGIWQDVELLVTEKSYIDDIFVQPQEDLKSVKILTTIINRNKTKRGKLEFIISEKEKKTVIKKTTLEIAVPENKEINIEKTISIDNPELWSPEHPFLYNLEVILSCNNKILDKSNVNFGVRFFTERDGNFYLNNRRVFIKSAISWGHYPKTIAYPTEELAFKEVKSAKSLGLNTLSAHRCCATPALLRAADELGLMIYQEPGGAPRNRPLKPLNQAEEFERELFLIKLENLAKRDRNHPSLIWWNCANEAGKDDTSNPENLKPYIDRMMKLLHKTDPSRLKTYTSAWLPTCMFRPYEKKYSLLMDMHTVINWPSLWRDHLYIQHINFSPPEEKMVFYNGESCCFTALSDLPSVMEEYGSVLPGSDGAEPVSYTHLTLPTN